jgi:tetratricopeptide (TPR) repeat protein
VRAYLGQRDSALEHLEQSQRLNPLDIARHAHWTAVCVAHFFAGDFEQAMDAAVEAIALWPESPPGLSLSAATCALCGREDQARDYARRLLAQNPAASVSSIGDQIALQAGNSGYLGDLRRGMRESGLPDS